MAFPAMAVLQQHDARWDTDIVIEPAARRRAAIESRGHSGLGAFGTGGVRTCSMGPQSGRKNPPACLSVVCNVRALYSAGSNFQQYFCGIRYLGHRLTSTEIFTGIIPGKYPSAGGVKHKRGSKR